MKVWAVYKVDDGDQPSEFILGVYSTIKRARNAKKAFQDEGVFLEYEPHIRFVVVGFDVDTTVLEGNEAGIWKETDDGRVAVESCSKHIN